jgi:hypothetical protein
MATWYATAGTKEKGRQGKANDCDDDAIDDNSDMIDDDDSVIDDKAMDEVDFNKARVGSKLKSRLDLITLLAESSPVPIIIKVTEETQSLLLQYENNVGRRSGRVRKCWRPIGSEGRGEEDGEEEVEGDDDDDEEEEEEEGDVDDDEEEDEEEKDDDDDEEEDEKEEDDEEEDEEEEDDDEDDNDDEDDDDEMDGKKGRKVDDVEDLCSDDSSGAKTSRGRGVTRSRLISMGKRSTEEELFRFPAEEGAKVCVCFTIHIIGT